MVAFQRRLAITFLLFSLLFPQTVSTQAQQPATTENSFTGPDLNLLRERVTEFWSLRRQGRRLEAMEYVNPAMRNNFLNQKEPPFSSFVLRSLSFLDDPASSPW